MNRLLALFVLLFAAGNGFVFPSLDALKMELIHRSALSTVRREGMDNLKHLHRRDLVRRAGIIQRRKATETSAGASVAMLMHAGADYGTGEYFVHVRVGTPGQQFMLIVNTGSELTWMNCRIKCGKKCGVGANKGIFRADRSSTFKTIPCQSQMCKTDLATLFSLSICPTPTTPCAYDYRYIQGSAAIGFFANETISVGLTNGHKRRLNNVLIGCTQSVRDEQEDFKGADGVLGLGFGNHTFINKVARDFGAKFSYCLVDHLSPKNVSNYIVFGPGRAETSFLSSMQHTEIVLGGPFGPLYSVRVSGVSVGGVLLKIPPEVWDVGQGGGTILDSGTSLTFLADPAYGPVMAQLSKSTSRFGNLPDDGGPFQFCFNSTRFDEALIPRLRIHFVDGSAFEPPVKSYVLEVAPQRMCLGFVAAAWPGPSTIGNIMQQNHYWEFDLEKNRLGFAPSTCT